MKNFIKKGNVLDYVIAGGGTAVVSGELVIIGGLVGVAVTNIAVGETGSVNLTGVYSVPKASGAITQGAKLYYVTADKNLSTTASGNTYVGFANKAALTGDTTVELILANGI